MRKTLLMLAMVAATSMVALAHGDDKDKDSKKKAGCCAKDGAKKEMTSKSCCSKDGAKTAKVEKTDKAEKVADKAAAPKN